MTVDQMRALGAFLRDHLKAALLRGEPDISPLRTIIADVQSRYEGYTPKYGRLAKALAAPGKRYGQVFPANSYDGNFLISRKIDDAKSGQARTFVDTLLHHYWHEHRQLLLAALRQLNAPSDAVQPFFDAADLTEAEERLAELHEIARRSLLPRRSYSAKDWEIAAHRMASERRHRTGRLDFAKLEIDMLPEPVLDMGWLTNLDCCVTLMKELPSLAPLRKLRTFDCSYSPLEALPSFTGCKDMVALWCGVTNVNDLSPVKDCPALGHLYCGRTLVDDLAPLAHCAQLEVLHCEETNVERLTGLEACLGLKLLDIQDTEVDDLSPLAGARNLETLILNGCRITRSSDAVWRLPNLREVFLHRGELTGVPLELLSRSYDDNCLQRIRSYLGLVRAERSRL